MNSNILKHISLLSLIAISPQHSYSQKQPNIIIAIADDMSHTSCYGYKFLKTPNVDALAKNGLMFTHMYTASSKSAPSRASILTGRNPWQLEAAANHQPVWPEKFKTIVESLTENGYATAYTGKGWDPGIHPKGRNLTGTAYNNIKCSQVPATGINNIDYSANFKKFLDDKPKDQPFFFWYGCKEPHRGYEYMSGVKNGKKLEDLDFLPTFWGDSPSVKNDILDYAFEVEYFDKKLGEIIKYLTESGELENTLIIVTSDNGMPFPRYKGHPYDFGTRIPFIVNWPGKITKPNRTVTDFASFIDVTPTLLEVAGISINKADMQPIEGKSLTDIFNNKPENRNKVITGRERNDACRPNGWGYPVRSLHKGDMVYMYNFEPDRWPCGDKETGYMDTDWSPTKTATLATGEGNRIFEINYGKRPQEELYNTKTDPECLKNLAQNKSFIKIKSEMKKELFAELVRQKDPRALGDDSIFTQYDYERRNNDYLKLLEQNNKKNK